MDKRYLFSYYHNGSDWSFEVQADNEKDAQDRVAKMAWAKLDGELFTNIPAKLGWTARATVWLLNRLKA